MKKRYFKFTDTDATPEEVPGILSGTHGIDRMATEMTRVGYLVEEVTAKEAARIRQAQNRQERLALVKQMPALSAEEVAEIKGAA